LDFLRWALTICSWLALGRTSRKSISKKSLICLAVVAHATGNAVHAIAIVVVIAIAVGATYRKRSHWCLQL
jgi:hypothetical protein